MQAAISLLKISNMLAFKMASSPFVEKKWTNEAKFILAGENTHTRTYILKNKHATLLVATFSYVSRRVRRSD